MVNVKEYPFEIRSLSEEEGGGFLISYTDFSECISDGETVEEAIAHGEEALLAVIETLEAQGFPVPEPHSGGIVSGKFLTRVPKTLHAKLTLRAKQDGVSLNSLVISLLAEGVGLRTRGLTSAAR